MASQGPFYPTTSVTGSVAPESNNDWTAVANVEVDNGLEAQITAATYDSPDISFRLRASAFGFTIPAGATIAGVLVEIDRRCFAGAAKDYRVQLFNGATAPIGDNKADTVNNWPATLTVKSYGGSVDLWNADATLTPAFVNGSSFTVVLSVSAAAANTDIGVNYIRVTVSYTEGADTALAGSSAGSSTAAGAATTQIALAGSAAGVATAVSSLATSIALVAASPGVASAAAALTTAIPLAVTAGALGLAYTFLEKKIKAPSTA